MSSNTPDLLSRFQGCLVGLAAGDSLGAPVEGMSSAAIKRRFGRITEMIGGGRLYLLPGEHTDDTAMMICIARSIVEKGYFNATDVAQKFVEWFDSDPAGIGRTTWIALSEIKRGVWWRDASRLAHRKLGGFSAGNGSIMRCAPIGLLDFKKEEKLVRDSMESSVITHWDMQARWGAATVNLVISCILRGEDGAFLPELAKKIKEPQVAKAVEEVCKLNGIDYDPSAYVLDTLQAALWCFVRTSSFEEALITAVNLGGDADTVGAVCGAVAGTRYGIESIPERWREPLQDRDEIMSLARSIYEIAIE